MIGEYDGSLIKNCSEISSRDGCWSEQDGEWDFCDEYHECLARNYSLIGRVSFPGYDAWVEELRKDWTNTPSYDVWEEELIENTPAHDAWLQDQWMQDQMIEWDETEDDK